MIQPYRAIYLFKSGKRTRLTIEIKAASNSEARRRAYDQLRKHGHNVKIVSVEALNALQEA